MSEVKVLGASVPNVPWQEDPKEFHGAPIWRYSENPVIGRNPIQFCFPERSTAIL